MGVERLFLGWDELALPRVAEVLLERYADNLEELIVALPTARSGRRLIERLVEQAGGAVTGLPTIETAGRLPEHLYEPSRPVADDWVAMLTRTTALQQSDPDLLGRLIADLPPQDDLPAWSALAKRLTRIHSDLAAAAMRLEQVIERIQQDKLDDTALDRLQILRKIEQQYDQAMDNQGLIDLQTARLDAIAQQRCHCDRPIVLGCVADLSVQLARMLEQLDSPVWVLIHAPPDMADRFDALGGLIASHWQNSSPPIKSQQLHFVDRPADQARCAAEILSTLSPSPNQVTLGLGDETLADTLRRTVTHAGATARYAAGRPMLQSRPATWLRGLGRFAANQRFDDLASLLRHPDTAAYLDQPQAVADWLTLLDRYANDHLQGRLFGAWLGESQRREQLKYLWDCVTALCPNDTALRPLPQWAQPIATALQKVYGHRDLLRHAPTDRDLVAALSAIGQVLRELACVEVAADTTFSQAIELVLQQLAGSSIPEPGGESAIELMGWLDLPLDDARLLIISGFNEGNIPASRIADPWLPDSMRTALGLTNNARRYSRDMYLLTAILHSRDVQLIAGCMTRDGDPLSPSRLLLACDDKTLVSRVRAFYQTVDEAPPEPAPLLTPADRHHFLIPPPLIDAPKLTQLSVTAFRDYLACPYRFYLKYVLKLRGIDDRSIELDALHFGSLAHRVLETLATHDHRHNTDPAAIYEWLSEQLDQQVVQQYGNEPRMAMRLQIEQLRTRLKSFAVHQAQWTRDGWIIMDQQTERQLTVPIGVDGQTITLVGRVDRIDCHPDKGYRILDYKTSDAGHDPDRIHRQGPKNDRHWVDLQLPLYRDLCAPLGVTGDVELGYINLPKKLEDTGLKLAKWDEQDLADAKQQRDTVIRGVLGGHYWPPKEPPMFDDDLRGICADMAFDRSALITASHGGSA